MIGIIWALLGFVVGLLTAVGIFATMVEYIVPMKVIYALLTKIEKDNAAREVE